MAFNTCKKDLVSPVAGPYEVVLYKKDSAALRVVRFATLAEAAAEVCRNQRPHWFSPTDWFIRSVASPRGVLLNLDELNAYGLRLREEAYAARRFPGYVRRQGPVPGVHCYRGGSCRFYRRLGSTPERRLAALVVKEDGEVAARAARTGRNIPDTRDEFARCIERSWKSQHRGRKAWDRTRCVAKDAA